MSRVVRRVVTVLLAVLATLTLRTVAAQEFRVFSVVHVLSAAVVGQRPPVVARATTLFHAGKVYDYVDAADEVIVYEPTARRFRVLNTSRGLVASVELDEIRQLLKIAREEAERQAAALARDPGAAKTGTLLHFQLDPKFEEAYDEAAGLLSLAGGPVRYTVRATDPKRPGVANAYLDSADWICRLNYLLHPGVMLPESRLALNRALREKQRLPELVELRADAASPIHLRAEHSLHFELNSQERNWIHQWESQLKSKTLREVPLREYQRVVLAARSR
jgi:hypothetical protein